MKPLNPEIRKAIELNGELIKETKHLVSFSVPNENPNKLLFSEIEKVYMKPIFICMDNNERIYNFFKNEKIVEPIEKGQLHEIFQDWAKIYSNVKK